MEPMTQPFLKKPDLIWGIVLFILALSFILLAYHRMLVAGMGTDEGFYLLCSHLFAEGLSPYSDFGFSQPPGFLWVYSKIMPLLDWSVSGIRMANVIIICLTLTIASLYLFESKRPLPSVLVWILAFASPGWIDASVLGKTHSLGGLLLLMASIVVLSNQKVAVRWGLFLVLASFGCLTRFTLAPYFVVCFLLLLVDTPTWKERIAAIIIFVILAVAVVYYIHGGNWESFYFWTIDLHRKGHWRFTGAIPGYVNMLDGWRHAPAVWIVLILCLSLRRIDRSIRIIALGLVISALGVVSSGSSYGEYVTPFVPAAMFLLASIVGPRLDDCRDMHSWRLLFPTGMILVIWFGWILRPVMWVTIDPSYLESVAETVAFAKQHVPKGSQVVSSVPEIAVEAGLRTPLKLSMGMFSLSLSIDQDRADRINVCTYGDLLQYLDDYNTKAFIGSTRGFDNFTFSIPELCYVPETVVSQSRDILHSNYSLCHVNSHYVVFLRKPLDPTEDNKVE